MWSSLSPDGWECALESVLLLERSDFVLLGGAEGLLRLNACSIGLSPVEMLLMRLWSPECDLA